MSSVNVLQYEISIVFKLLYKSVFLFVFLKKRTKNVYGVSVSLEIRIVKMFYVNLLLH